MTKAESDARWMAGQAAPGLVTVGDPRLRAGGHPIEDVAEAVAVLKRMTALLRELNGAGLAAPQIGVPLALAVVEVRRTALFPDRPESPLLWLADPDLTALNEVESEDWEGCFSVPGLMGLVPRSERVRVTYRMLPGGESVTQEFSGYLARVIQHEVDHLNGRLFLDRMTSMVSITTVDNYQRHHGVELQA